MARIIKVRGDYLLRTDAGIIPAKDMRLIKCAPQLFNALQHAAHLLSRSGHGKEAQAMAILLDEIMSGKKTDNYRAEKMTGHKFYTVQSFDIEGE
jgi:hypothetical protein